MVRYNWSVCQQSRNEQNLTFDPKFNIFAKEKQQKEQPDFSSLKQAEADRFCILSAKRSSHRVRLVRVSQEMPTA